MAKYYWTSVLGSRESKEGRPGRDRTRNDLAGLRCLFRRLLRNFKGALHMAHRNVLKLASHPPGHPNPIYDLK